MVSFTFEGRQYGGDSLENGRTSQIPVEHSHSQDLDSFSDCISNILMLHRELYMLMSIKTLRHGIQSDLS